MIGCGCRIMVRVEVSPFSTIFKKAENCLSEYEEAVLKLSKRKKVDKYKSLMDFLFCEVFPNWKYPCHLYYQERGDQLSQTLEEKEVKQYDAYLMGIVLSAKDCCDDKISWGDFVSIFRSKCFEHDIYKVFKYLDFEPPRRYLSKHVNWKK